MDEFEKRALILEASSTVFGEHGFESTTIKHIARKAGISAGSIYNYFQDKEDLFKSTVEEGWRTFLSELQNIVDSSQTFPEKFDRLLNFGLDLLKRAHPLLRGMLFAANQRDLLQEKLEQLVRDLDDLFHEGKKQGFLPVSPPREQRRFSLRTTVLGIMLSVSLTPPEDVEKEIENIRQGLTGYLFGVPGKEFAP